jgi:hypothetical protein
MFDHLEFVDTGSCTVDRPQKELRSAFCPKGKFKVQHIRGGTVIGRYEFDNGIVDVGINHILDTEFHSGTQITTWNVGLVNNASFSGFANADTMSSHAGWVESTDYSEGNRPAWGAGAAVSRQITNATTVDFSINTTVTIKGILVVGGTGSSTKGGTTGTLWSTGAFGTNVACNAGDTLKVTYTIAG